MPEIQVVFRAVTTEFEKALTNIANKIEETEKRFSSLAKAADTFSRVGKTLTANLTAPLAAVSTAAMFASKKFAEFADKISDMQAMTGMSSTAIQEWMHVARVAGEDADVVAQSIANFIKKLPTLALELGTSSKLFKMLGLSLEELQKMHPDKAFETLVYRLADIQDPITRNAVGATLFGMQWKEMSSILALGTTNIKKAREEAHRLGLVWDDAVLRRGQAMYTTFLTLQAQILRLTSSIAVALGPVLDNFSAVLEKITPVVDRLGEAIQKIPVPIQKFAIIAGVALAFIGPLLVALSAAVKVFIKLVAITGLVAKAVSAVVTNLGKLGLSFKLVTGLASATVGAFFAVDAAANRTQKNLQRVAEELEKLKKTMQGSIDPVNEVANALEIIKQASTVEIGTAFEAGLRAAIDVLSKYGITLFEAGDALKQFSGNSLDAARVLLIQKGVIKDSSQALNEMTQALSKLNKQSSKNIQSFDEVHLILTDVEGALSGIVGSEELANLAQTTKELDEALEGANEGLEDMNANLEDLNPDAAEAWGHFRMMDETLRSLSEGFLDWERYLPDFRLELEGIPPSIEEIVAGFSDFSFTIESALGTVEVFGSGLVKVSTDFKDFADFIPDFSKALQISFENTDLLSTSLEDLSLSITEVNTGIDVATQGMQMFNTTLDAVPTTLDATSDALKDVRLETEGLSEATTEISQALNNITVSTEEVQAGVQEVGKSFDLMSQGVKNATVALPQISEQFELLQETTPSLSTSLNTIGTSIKGFGDVLKSLPEPLRNTTSATDALKNSLQGFGLSLQLVPQNLENTKTKMDAFKQAIENARPVTEEFKNNMTIISTTSSSLSNNMQLASNATNGFNTAISSARTQLGQLQPQAQATATTINSMSQSFTTISSTSSNFNNTVNQLKPAFEQLSSSAVTLGNSLQQTSGAIQASAVALTELKNQATGIKTEVQSVSSNFTAMAQAINNVSSTSNSFNSALNSMQTTFKNLQPQISGVAQASSSLSSSFNSTSSAAQAFGTSISTATQAFSNLNNSLKDSATNLQSARSGFDQYKMSMQDVSARVNEVVAVHKTKLPEVKTATQETTTAVVQTWQNTYQTLVGASIITDLVNGIVALFQSLKPKVTSTINDVSSGVVNAFSNMSKAVTDELNKNMKPALDELDKFLQRFGLSAKEVANTIKFAFTDMGKGIAGALWDLMTGNKNAADAIKAIWDSVGSSFRYIFVTVMGQVIGTALSQLAGWVVNLVAQAATALGSLLAQAYAGLVAFYWFLGPGAPVAAAATIAAALGAIVAFAAYAASAIKRAFGLAEGGIVTKPTFALIGEAGPEAVIPLDETLPAAVEQGVFNALVSFKSMYGDKSEEQKEIVIELDGNVLARSLIPYVLREFDRIGLALGGA